MRTAQVKTQLQRTRLQPRPITRSVTPRRRVPKATVTEIIERALQQERQEKFMFELAAERSEGPMSALFRRLAMEEQFQIEYFREWYARLPDAVPLDNPRIEADRKRLALAMEVQIAQLPDSPEALLAFVIEQERAYRDFYLEQRLSARGKKLRSILLDLADEEHIHLNLLLQFAGLPPEPRLELEAL